MPFEENSKRTMIEKRAKTKRGRKPNAKVAAKSQPCTEVPPAPEILNGDAREYWDRHAPQLVASNILTPLLVDSFAMCCQQYAEYQRWHRWLSEDASRYFYTTESGYEQITPAVNLRDKAMASWYRLACKFGLTADALAKMRKHGGIGATKKAPAVIEFARKKREHEEDASE
jgi:P27 family predicted phage terminase small subunit